MGQKGNICKPDQLSLTQSKQSKQKKSGKCGQSQPMATLLDQILGVVFNCLCISICCLIFVSLVFSSVKLLLCGWCCGHYLFDTLNTDRTRAGAHPITSYHRFYFSARCLICCKTRFNIQLLKIHNLDQSIELYCKSHNQGILNSKID